MLNKIYEKKLLDTLRNYTMKKKFESLEGESSQCFFIVLNPKLN